MHREKKPQATLYEGDGEIIVPRGQSRPSYLSRPDTQRRTASCDAPAADRAGAPSPYARPTSVPRSPYARPESPTPADSRSSDLPVYSETSRPVFDRQPYRQYDARPANAVPARQEYSQAGPDGSPPPRAAGTGLYGRYQPQPAEPDPDPRDTDYDELQPRYYISDNTTRMRRRRKRQKPFFALWLVILLLSLSGIIALGLAVAPQLLGIQYGFLPNIAFVDHKIVRMDTSVIR